MYMPGKEVTSISAGRVIKKERKQRQSFTFYLYFLNPWGPNMLKSLYHWITVSSQEGEPMEVAYMVGEYYVKIVCENLRSSNFSQGNCLF